MIRLRIVQALYPRFHEGLPHGVGVKIPRSVSRGARTIRQALLTAPAVALADGAALAGDPPGRRGAWVLEGVAVLLDILV